MLDLRDLIIGLDFDGTVVTHAYPFIGEPLPGCIEVLKRCIDSGAKICLNTMRSGDKLEAAVQYLTENGIELYGINCNPKQSEWTDSPKVHAHLYIDDAALGAPTIQPPGRCRPEICWTTVESMLFPPQY